MPIRAAGKPVGVLGRDDLGIKVGECSEISRELGKVLDEAGFFERPYHLEVSSPGIDKPLRLLRQYHKNVGRRFKVAYRLEGKPATLIGKLESILDDRLTFSPENGEPLTLEFSQIIESKEELPW